MPNSDFSSAAVDHPVGVEDLVPAVLGVGLGEHHQLDVGRVAPHAAEVLHQVVDLVLGQREAQLAVGPLQRSAAAGEDVHGGERLRLVVVEERVGVIGGISTDSVMRSCSSACSTIERRSRHAVVHWWAMSVALDDQGEIVPRRGTTRRKTEEDSAGAPRSLRIEVMFSGNRVVYGQCG
jgi:hypothetical protein